MTTPYSPPRPPGYLRRRALSGFGIDGDEVPATWNTPESGECEVTDLFVFAVQGRRVRPRCRERR
ncbi:hypothetical protein ABZ860_41875 [Microbispora sp. NPDC046973]|uniref:hypothetical protein n=1 Tax=Microbispora sp. NPDC046973 TaxID=3155022 RepID=UPI0033E03D3B